MRPRARTSSLGSVARLHAFLLLVFCLRAGLCAEPDEELGRAKAIPVEHLKSIACEDRTTGIEFSPLGICFDLMGDLYVVDSDHSRIYLLDSTAERLTVFSECPSRYPGCELIDLAGNQIGGVYVSDRLTGSVLALDRWGELAAYAEAGEGVAGIAAGRAGKVFAALGIDGSIRIVDFDTETRIPIRSTAGGSAMGGW
jgi:DNA-binding beta-propeller fold protein YncE